MQKGGRRSLRWPRVNSCQQDWKCGLPAAPSWPTPWWPGRQRGTGPCSWPLLAAVGANTQPNDTHRTRARGWSEAGRQASEIATPTQVVWWPHPLTLVANMVLAMSMARMVPVLPHPELKGEGGNTYTYVGVTQSTYLYSQYTHAYMHTYAHAQTYAHMHAH